MEIGIVEYLQGIFSLIFIIIAFLIGLHILLKYFEHKRRELIFVGITLIGISFPWLPDAINLILIIFLNTYINDVLYFIIAMAFIPIVITFWLTAFTDLLYKKDQKVILIAYIIIGIIFEVIFFILLFQNTQNIGKYLTPFQVEYSLFSQIYLLSTLAFFVIPGILIARASLRSENPEIKLKGKLLLTALILITIEALVEALAPLIAITVVLTRIILISSAILFYGGFILPNWMKKIFLTS